MEKLPRFNHSQHFLGHGYKELTIPPKDGGGLGSGWCGWICPAGSTLSIDTRSGGTASIFEPSLRRR